MSSPFNPRKARYRGNPKGGGRMARTHTEHVAAHSNNDTAATKLKIQRRRRFTIKVYHSRPARVVVPFLLPYLWLRTIAQMNFRSRLPETAPMAPITAYLALGSNLGDRKANLNPAIGRLRETPGMAVVRVSSSLERQAACG